MEAGKELDALIHTRVMGLPLRCTRCEGQGAVPGSNGDCFICRGTGEMAVHDYSTDIAAAWKVVEKLRELKLQFELRVSPGTLWVVWVTRLSLVPFQDDEHLSEVKAETVPHAICLAALEYLGQ